MQITGVPMIGGGTEGKGITLVARGSQLEADLYRNSGPRRSSMVTMHQKRAKRDRAGGRSMGGVT